MPTNVRLDDEPTKSRKAVAVTPLVEYFTVTFWPAGTTPVTWTEISMYPAASPTVRVLEPTLTTGNPFPPPPPPLPASSSTMVTAWEFARGSTVAPPAVLIVKVYVSFPSMSGSAIAVSGAATDQVFGGMVTGEPNNAPKSVPEVAEPPVVET